jgi:hypothetical protein
MTHHTNEKAVNQAIKQIAEMPTVADQPERFRILE